MDLAAVDEAVELVFHPVLEDAGQDSCCQPQKDEGKDHGEKLEQEEALPEDLDVASAAEYQSVISHHFRLLHEAKTTHTSQHKDVRGVALCPQAQRLMVRNRASAPTATNLGVLKYVCLLGMVSGSLQVQVCAAQYLTCDLTVRLCLSPSYLDVSS